MWGAGRERSSGGSGGWARELQGNCWGLPKIETPPNSRLWVPILHALKMGACSVLSAQHLAAGRVLGML